MVEVQDPPQTTAQAVGGPPRAPSSLPSPRLRNARGGALRTEIGASLEVITPILGGGSQTRQLDKVDVIRGATIRGHLRFWWRALYAHQCANAAELYARESALWGRAANDEGGRSVVELRVMVTVQGEVDSSEIAMQSEEAYALWPARGEKSKGTPTAERRLPGTKFQLTLTAPAQLQDEVRNALRAWILFGGYGGRTRRGLGSVRVVENAAAWLPRTATRDGLKDLFGWDILAPVSKKPGDTAWLAGAALHVGKPQVRHDKAWTTALGWLREFRQGTGSGARNPAPNGDPKRPSISNWPEPDKVRQLSRPKRGLPWAHKPRHNATPAWPRAGFGLPIIGQFQGKSRSGDYWENLPQTHANFGTEPGNYELRWRAGHEEHDRLASPLIVKALPLADGTSVACALWLQRAYPAGEVVLKSEPRSGAPFDRLVAPGDEPLFPPLQGKQTLRQAFLDWIFAKYTTTEVAP